MSTDKVSQFGSKVSSQEKDILRKILSAKIQENILCRVLSGNDISHDSIILDAANIKISGGIKSFSERCTQILADTISDEMPLNLESIDRLSQQITAIMFQDILQRVGQNMSLLDTLEETGYKDLVSHYKKALYLLHDFRPIIVEMVKKQLKEIDQSDFLSFLPKGEINIATLGKNEEEIVNTIEKMFFEMFGDVPFDIQNIIYLKISGFDHTALEEAKKKVIKNKTIIRI